jgi:hypothetical protein
VNNTTLNSYNHEREGQNVGYRDGSVAWATTPSAGPDGDNIWTYGGSGVDNVTNLITAHPASRRDSFMFP